jgi:hypothetical protein
MILRDSCKLQHDIHFRPRAGSLAKGGVLEEECRVRYVSRLCNIYGGEKGKALQSLYLGNTLLSITHHQSLSAPYTESRRHLKTKSKQVYICMGIETSTAEANIAAQDVSVLIAKLESIAKGAPKNEAARKKLYDAAQSLTTVLEPPANAIQRITYLVSVIYKLTHHYFESRTLRNFDTDHRDKSREYRLL